MPWPPCSKSGHRNGSCGKAAPAHRRCCPPRAPAAPRARGARRASARMRRAMSRPSVAGGEPEPRLVAELRGQRVHVGGVHVGGVASGSGRRPRPRARRTGPTRRRARARPRRAAPRSRAPAPAPPARCRSSTTSRLRPGQRRRRCRCSRCRSTDRGCAAARRPSIHGSQRAGDQLGQRRARDQHRRIDAKAQPGEPGLAEQVGGRACARRCAAPAVRRGARARRRRGAPPAPSRGCRRAGAARPAPASAPRPRRCRCRARSPRPAALKALTAQRRKSRTVRSSCGASCPVSTLPTMSSRTPACARRWPAPAPSI